MNRTINTETKRLLKEESRNRCVISGHLIFEEYDNLDIVEKVLDKHHIQYVKDGAPNTFDNLIVVCPNCHRKIHARREIYRDELLKEAKLFWSKMKFLVPSNLIYNSEEENPHQRYLPNIELVNIRFRLLTPNLVYEIKVPNNIKILNLVKFINGWIIRPLKYYSTIAPFPMEFGRINSKNSKLSFSNQKNIYLQNDKLVGEYDFSQSEIVMTSDISIIAVLAKPPKSGLANITLRWNELPRDLDLHLAIYKENILTTINYSNKGNLEISPFAKLDKDVQNGYGPETISVGVDSKSKYLIFVNNYSGETSIQDSNAIIEFEFTGRIKIIKLNRTNEIGKYWVVGKINLNDGEFEEINTVTNTNPTHNNI